MKRIFTSFMTVLIICGFFAAFYARNADGYELMDIVDDENFYIADGVLSNYKGKGGDVTIPEGVKALGKNLFLNFYKEINNFKNKKINTLVFPSTLMEIRYRALSNITVGKIVIPDTIEEITIGQQAFAIPNNTDGGDRKSNLTEVIINAKSVILGSEGASDTKASECFRVLNSTLTNSALERVIFTSESIKQACGISALTYLFYNCKSLKEVVFSGGGSYVIGNLSFSGCSSLESVIFSEGMTGITDSYLFYGCASLKEIILPKSCRNIGSEFLRTSSDASIKDVAILSEELENLENDSFTTSSTQTKLDIYAYPGTSAWEKLEEARYIKDDQTYPAKHTLKTLTRDATITVQGSAGPGTTTVHWDAYRWLKRDGKGDENTGTNLEASILTDGHPSFETTVLDAWYTAISEDISVKSAEPDRFLHNEEDHPFEDAGGIPLEDGDIVYFYRDPKTSADLASITMNPGDVILAVDEKGGYFGTLGCGETDFMLSVEALNPGSEITLTGDIDGDTYTPDETIALTHGDYTNVSLPAKVGLNRFTVEIKPENQTSPSKNYQVIIMRKPDYALPKLDVGKEDSGGSESAEAGVIGANDFIDFKNEAATSGNAPVILNVQLAEASPIKITLPANLTDDAVASAVFEALEKDDGTGLRNMIESEAIALDGDGNVIANRQTLRNRMTAEDKAAYALKDMVGLPAFTTEVTDAKYTAAITYKGAFAAFEGVPAKDLAVLKLRSDGAGVYYFKPALSLEHIAEGEFVITNTSGGKIVSDEPLAGNELLTVAIRDGGALDWNGNDKEITDPPTVAKNAVGGGSDDNGGGARSGSDATGTGGGCDAGLGAWAAIPFAAAAVCLRMKRRGARPDGKCDMFFQ
jgi:hypothetical protein